MEQGIIENLINELTKLPGIGRKTAQRACVLHPHDVR